MPRRKIPATTAGATTGGVFLDDDEQLVEEVTTTKKIGRQRRTPADEAEPIAAEPVFADDPDDDDEIETPPPFSQTSLAAAVYGTDGETIEDQFCTVAVRRNPDTMRDKFAVPCSSLSNLPRLTNISLSTDKADIEEQVRSEYGGGHYFFQIQMNGRLGHSWKATLLDLPGWKSPAAEPQHEPTPAAAPAPAADPMDSMLASMEKQQRMRELMFGDAERRMQAEIDRLRTEAETARNTTPPEPVSEEILLWKMAKEMPESEAKNRLLDKLVPTDAEGNRHWIADVASVVMENKDTILGLVGSLFGGGGTAPAAQPSVADLMRQPAPAALPERKPVFNRKIAEPEPPTVKADPAPAETPPPADTPPVADENCFVGSLPLSEFVPTNPAEADDLTKGDETAIDAEITEETKVQKPARSKGVSRTKAAK